MEQNDQEVLSGMAENQAAAADDDEDEAADEDDHVGEAIQIMLKGHAGQYVDAEGDGGQHSFDCAQEMIEQYEEHHAGASETSESELARGAAAQCFHADEAVDDQGALDQDAWANEQEQEVMESERTKLEVELATRALSTGQKVAGSSLLEIAQSEMMDSCLVKSNHLWPSGA